MSLLLQDPAQGVEDLGPGAQRLGERRGADRHDHELLEVHAAVGVRPAVEDVHHRHRQHLAALGATVQACEVLVERHVRRSRGCACERHQTPSRALAPRRPLFSVPSRSFIALSTALIGVVAGERLRDFAVHMADRLRDPLAEIPLLVPVAELERLALPGRRARGTAARPHRAVVERDLDFNRRIPRESMISRPWTL